MFLSERSHTHDLSLHSILSICSNSLCHLLFYIFAPTYTKINRIMLHYTIVWKHRREGTRSSQNNTQRFGKRLIGTVCFFLQGEREEMVRMGFVKVRMRWELIVDRCVIALSDDPQPSSAFGSFECFLFNYLLSLLLRLFCSSSMTSVTISDAHSTRHAVRCSPSKDTEGIPIELIDVSWMITSFPSCYCRFCHRGWIKSNLMVHHPEMLRGQG